MLEALNRNNASVEIYYDIYPVLHECQQFNKSNIECVDERFINLELDNSHRE